MPRQRTAKPAGSDPPDAKGTAMDLLNRAEEKAEEFLANLVHRRVLYYPAGALDWEPIQTFATACDTFVYCDWRVPFSTVSTAVIQRCGTLLCWASNPLEHLTNMADLPWDAAPGVEAGSPGLVAERRPATDQGNAIQLAYFVGNPVTLYRNLFAAQRTAPLFICLNRPADVPIDRWQAFVAPDGPLATAVRENTFGPRPQYVSRDIIGPAPA